MTTSTGIESWIDAGERTIARISDALRAPEQYRQVYGVGYSSALAWECQICAAVTTDRDKHTDWHHR